MAQIPWCKGRQGGERSVTVAMDTFTKLHVITTFPEVHTEVSAGHSISNIGVLRGGGCNVGDMQNADTVCQRFLFIVFGVCTI